MREMIDWEGLREISRAICRKWKLIAGLLLVYMVLFTEVNLNPSLESLADPNVDVDAAVAKKEQGDYAALVPVLIRGIAEAEDKPYFHYVLAEYYRKGAPPFHVDHCSAFDHYFEAAKLGDTDAQLEVAKMLMSGIAGYQSAIRAYLLALHAKRNGNEHADIVLDVYILSRLSEEARSLLEQIPPDLTTQSFDDFYPTYRLPVIPVLWRMMRLIVPMRICNDPSVLDHIRLALN